ncbi:MAG TPA: FixH family protein [Symbiobacteriaceae bacterium]|nr:FixH family protein [Symbiobacteriaceae bacterium]
MAKSYWQRAALIVTGLALVGALAGCAAAGTAAVTPPVKKPVTGFQETAKADDLNVTLTVEPLKVGDNHVAVKVAGQDVQAVEAQIIMASMGHGQIVDLNPTAAGTFEIDTPAIDMEGRWMVRINVTDAAGTAKTAVFHMVVK